MKANLIELMPDIRGCYLLTANGGLGSYGEDKVFRTDDRLSQALSALINSFVRDFKRTHNTKGWRIGIVHTDHADQPWNSATLALEDHVLRDLYPMPGSGPENLTAFQHGNREKSLFRGLELLLDHHDPMAPSAPSFCPVLVFRSTTLAQYTHDFGREQRLSDEQTPVVEVIDLLANATLTQSCHPAVAQLVRSVRRDVIKPERRCTPNLHMLDEARDSKVARMDPLAMSGHVSGYTRRLA